MVRALRIEDRIDTISYREMRCGCHGDQNDQSNILEVCSFLIHLCCLIHSARDGRTEVKVRGRLG